MKSVKAAFYEGNRNIRTGTSTCSKPAAEEVQIRVAYCGLCGTDLHIYHGSMDKRVRFPQIIGHEMSGVIEATGEDISEWKAGDRITVRPILHCGQCAACRAGHSHICMQLKFMGIDSAGAMQGLWNVPAHTLHRLPDSLSLEQGALIEPLAVACHDVGRANVNPGDYVVVLGGGPIGLLIALVTKAIGANALVSEINPFRLALAHSFGIATLNPKEEDLASRVSDASKGVGADVVFEVSGVAAAVESMTKIARPRGRLVMVAIHPKPATIDLFQFFWRELSLAGARLYGPQDFERAIELAASGCLPLDRMISEIKPIEDLLDGLQAMEHGGEVMKILIRCS